MDIKKNSCYNGNRKKYEDLTFLDDFMFCKVMRNPEICKRMLETILSIEIDHIEYPQTQKSIDILADAKSIRMDVYVKGEDQTVYNVETQTTNTGELPRRSRYYQGLIDMDLIEKGEPYSKLNKSYVIFICTFDPFTHGYPIYTFTNRCREDNQVVLEDGTTKVFVNLTGMTDILTEGQKALFEYLNNKLITDIFTQLIESYISSAKSNMEWRREFMTLDMKIQEECNKALAIGKEEGAREKTIDFFKKLIDNGFSVDDAKTLSGISDEDAEDCMR